MKKKWFYILIAIIASAMLVAGIVFLFVVNYGVKKPDAVSITTSNGKTYISTSLSTNEFGYIYKFENASKNTDIYLYETTNNLICADNLIESGAVEIGTTYKVTVRYKNEYENGYSGYSKPVSWLASVFLNAPTISLDSDKIKWEAVENADYYTLYYSHGADTLSLQTGETSVELAGLEGGQHTFYVIASSEKEEYFDSVMSNKVVATAYHRVQQFLSTKFYTSTGKLVMNALEDLDCLTVYIGTNQNDALAYEYSYQTGGSTFTKKGLNVGVELTINLSEKWTAESLYVAVEPKVSGYNVYTGGRMVATFA